MMHFRYRAYDGSGAPCQGELQAVSHEAALAMLAGEGMLPVEVQAASGPAPVRWWQIEVWPSGGLSGARLAQFMRDLAALVVARVPLEEALRLVRDQQAAGKPAHRTAATLHRAVLEGAALSDAMLDQGAAIPPHVAEIVRAGEKSGRLGEVLTEIAGFLETATRRRAELATALVYPAILVLAALAALTIVMTELVPTILPLFRDAGATPPRLILLMGRLTELAAAGWPLLVAAAVMAVPGTVIARRSSSWQLARDRLVLVLPWVSTLAARNQTARIGRMLSVLLGNGVPLLDAVRVVGGALENRVYAQATGAIVEDLKTGVAFSDALARTGLLDAVHVRLVAIGERTGTLAVMLARIAEQCEEQVDRELRRLLTMLAPLLTLVIGGVVGGLILSVMGAIAGLNDLALK